MPHAKILYVEDDSLLRLNVQELLESEGLAVETCADGNDALNKLASAARYDLILLDNQLPGASGLELVSYARSLAHRRDTPIIVVSATEVGAEAIRAGADEFLKKPHDADALLEVVRRLIFASGKVSNQS
jgi:CheY-like chemotaxis protein